MVGAVFRNKSTCWWIRIIRSVILLNRWRAAESLSSGTTLRSMWTITGLLRTQRLPRARFRLRLLLPRHVPSFCLACSNDLNSKFCYRERGRTSGPSLQESRGDSRPQALLIRGFASPARRRVAGLGELALLGLSRIGGDDSALCRRKNPSRLRRHRTWADLWFQFFCLLVQQGG